MKKITILCLMVFSTTVFADYLALIGREGYNEGFVYDAEGFNAEGTHKDTGTLFNLEGFDKDGFDESGLGTKDCQKSISNYSIAHYEYNANTKLYWGGVFLGNFTRAADYTFDNSLYTYDTSDSSGSYTGGYVHWAVCKQDYKAL